MNREMLEQEFDKSLIKTRKGSYGTEVDYVETWAVIQRLNDATDGAWPFEIVDWIINDDEVIVLGKMTIEGITKMQFGGKRIAKNSKTGKIISLGDDLKAAASDCLKKIATLFGVGNTLYRDDVQPEHPVTNKSNDKITKEQLAKIKGLRTALGWSADQVQEQAQKMFKTEVTELNPTMAGAFIAFLEKQGKNNETPF